MGNYIKLFETHSAYNTYITGGDAILPNVSYCEDQNGVHYNPWVETRVVAKFNVTDTSTEIPIANYMGGPTSTTDGIDEIEIDGVVQPTTKNTYLFGTTGDHTVKYTLSNPTTIVNYGFEGCSDMVNITIPNTVTTIGDSALAGCKGLTEILIPSSVTSIGKYLFSSSFNLTSISVENGNPVYDSRNNCNAIIETSTNTLIRGCSNSTIPDGVTSIAESAFNGCGSGLTSVTIPSSVTSISSMAFSYCSGLASVTIEATIPPTLIGYSIFTDNASGRKFYVPAESVNTYKAASGWSDYAADIEAIQ